VHISTRNTSGTSCTRSYRTLRDGSSEDAFPGTSCQATIGVSLRDVLADAWQRHSARERASDFVTPALGQKTSQTALNLEEAPFSPRLKPERSFVVELTTSSSVHDGCCTYQSSPIKDRIVLDAGTNIGFSPIRRCKIPYPDAIFVGIKTFMKTTSVKHWVSGSATRDLRISENSDI
jgi:hypothetical protein